jgi:hypothetical protein
MHDNFVSFLLAVLTLISSIVLMGIAFIGVKEGGAGFLGAAHLLLILWGLLFIVFHNNN